LIAGISNPNFDLVNTSINAQNYEWYLDDVLISTNKDLNWTINQVGKFCFKLIAFGDCNQKDSITKCVEVVDQGVISFPNVFSPNGDNLNDVFRPIIKGDYTITNFQIFNRWGQSVYQFRNYSTKPEWDGTYQGERCEMGTYFYMAEVSDGMGVHQMIKGDVILLR
jgi:gliding motility-associated-like protein